MKTYQSNTNDKKKNFFKRHWHALVVVAAVVVIAVVVTLSVVLTLPKSKPVETPPVNDDPVTPPPVNVVTEPKVVLPVQNGQVGLGYAFDKLVYWDTLELWRTHPAIDFVCDGDVVSILDGTVTDVEMHTVLDGNVVTVTHDNGYVSVYKSLGDDITVKVGDKVNAGDKLGVTSGGMLSELNTGAHLHLELKKDGKYVDPTTVLPLNQDK